MRSLAILLLCIMGSFAHAQQSTCPTCPNYVAPQYGAAQCEGGVCSLPAIVTPNGVGTFDVRVPCNNFQLILHPLRQADQDDINITSLPTTMEAAATDDRFSRVVKATCRITVSGVCGSGTVVGRDSAGNALVLTNAHVAGTQRGRVVSVERWNPDGTSEKGNGAIIASGYGRGMSVDFALLKCNAGFAENVTPIPLADRYPDVNAGVTTYGCPRCEWPSMQVLKLNRKEGQVLSWSPEAIGGRSGSSLVDYTEAGPRVVGLLTWGGGGEGLGQSTPFLLQAMRGVMPKSFETLPAHAQEVSTESLDCSSRTHVDLPAGILRMPCCTSGDLLISHQPSTETEANTDDVTIDAIIEHGPDQTPDEDGIFGRRPPRDPAVPILPRPGSRLAEWIRRVMISLVIAAGAAAVGYLFAKWRAN